jgi:hypothetical protein
VAVKKNWSFSVESDSSSGRETALCLPGRTKSEKLPRDEEIAEQYHCICVACIRSRPEPPFGISDAAHHRPPRLRWLSGEGNHGLACLLRGSHLLDELLDTLADR